MAFQGPFLSLDMPLIIENYQRLTEECKANRVTLVAVSKTKPTEDLLQMYQAGQRDFGENYVQELMEKQKELPGDIRWHFIGHLQSNKVKYIASFIHLIHGIDSRKLLKETDKQAALNNRVIDVLLQVHIAREQTKFGLSEEELEGVINSLKETPLPNIRVRGLMGMASYTEDENKVRSEFTFLKTLFDRYHSDKSRQISWDTLSMGMSGDYKIAIQEGSTMIRIGSLIFGERNRIN